MSSNERFGYGIDIKLLYNSEGTIDLDVDETGDLALVGGDGEADILVKVENIIQQMAIRLQTPFGGLKDEYGESIDLGSNLHELVGGKNSDINALIIKTYIMNALVDLSSIKAIIDIRLLVDRKNNPTLMKAKIFFKLEEDDNIYFNTVNLVNTEA